jgi:hypothetical protein
VKIEGTRCKCDDPGLTGFILGVPVGMIVGGGIGYKLGRWERLAAMTRLRSVSPAGSAWR